MPNAWISRVLVSNSKFMSRVDVAMNPQYTALIGGRGTGKSTILDYLRWALCDQPAQSGDEDEVANPRVRQRRLIDATLKPLDAHVEVHCLVNGIPHVVRRYAADGSVQLKVGDAEFEKVREANIQSLLSIQAYSQKQLSSVAIRVDELLRFVTSPIQRKLEDVDRRTQEVAGRLRENYGTLQRHRTLTAEIERTDLRARSLSDQAKVLRDGLGGISEDDRKVLDGKAGHDGVRAANGLWQQQVESLQHALSDLIEVVDSSLASVARPDVVPDAVATESDAALSATRSALTDLRTGLLAVGENFGRSGQGDGPLAASVGALVAKLDVFDTEYAAVKERSSAHEAKLTELTGLEEQQKAALDLGQRQKKERDGLGDPVDQHKRLRAELIAIRKERTDALAEQCAALSTSSDGMIRAHLSSSAGFGEAQEKFKGLIQGSNVRTSRLSDFFDQLAKESNPAATWETALVELEQLMLLEPDADVKSEQTPVLSSRGIPVADQKRIAPKLTPDGWLDLSLTILSDVPQFEYKAKEGEYISFDSASAGQQASALLATLLSQTGTPLIIDQPEDDLDSDTVQQIVTKIWASKSGRQLIFSSHNANLVVNGDADLVLVCAYVNSGDQSAGHIKQQGAIDIAAVRAEITSVMEGGEKAFRLRKEKYGF